MHINSFHSIRPTSTSIKVLNFCLFTINYNTKAYNYNYQAIYSNSATMRLPSHQCTCSCAHRISVVGVIFLHHTGAVSVIFCHNDAIFCCTSAVAQITLVQCKFSFYLCCTLFHTFTYQAPLKCTLSLSKSGDHNLFTIGDRMTNFILVYGHQ